MGEIQGECEAQRAEAGKLKDHLKQRAHQGPDHQAGDAYPVREQEGHRDDADVVDGHGEGREGEPLAGVQDGG